MKNKITVEAKTLPKLIDKIKEEFSKHGDVFNEFSYSRINGVYRSNLIFKR